VKFLDKQDILQKFIAFAEKQGIKEKPKDIRISQKILKVQLDAYIARNFLDNDGFFPIIQEIDNTLEKAVETLQ
jgi:carboxyl-terminal processing protease